jgi:hypothetical protein
MKWTPPARPMLDIATEGPAIRDLVRSGLMDPESAIRERGEDPDEVLAAWSRFKKKADELGLVFDCDPSKVTQVGNFPPPVRPAARRPAKSPTRTLIHGNPALWHRGRPLRRPRSPCRWSTRSRRRPMISVRINSLGGLVFDGFAIYNALKQSPRNVTVHIDGIAGSIASIIAMAGDTIIMAENAVMMIHKPSDATYGTAPTAADRRTARHAAEPAGQHLCQAHRHDAGRAQSAARRRDLDDCPGSARDQVHRSDRRRHDARPTCSMPPISGSRRYPITRSSRKRRAARRQPPPSKPRRTSWIRLSIRRPACRSPPQLLRRPPRPCAGTARPMSPTSRLPLRMPLCRRTRARLDDPQRSDPRAPQLPTISPTRWSTKASPIDVARTRIIDAYRARSARHHQLSRRRLIPAAQFRRPRRGDGARDRAPRQSAQRADRRGARFAGRRLIVLARDWLDATGVNTRNMGDVEVAQQVFRNRGRSMPVSTRPAISRRCWQHRRPHAAPQSYELAPKTFQAFCRQSTVPDFRPVSRVALSDISRCSRSPRVRNITYATVGDSAETYTVGKWGQIISLTWETIINDDLAAFDRLPMAMGQEAAQVESDVVYAILISNPNMADGVALFHATTATWPAPAPRSRSRRSRPAGSRCARRKAPKGRFLNITPATLVVGPLKEAGGEPVHLGELRRDQEQRHQSGI